jgi:tetratricopeptide (TPR) repeat protein
MKTCYRILNSNFGRRAIAPILLLFALCAVAGAQGSATKLTPEEQKRIAAAAQEAKLTPEQQEQLVKYAQESDEITAERLRKIATMLAKKPTPMMLKDKPVREALQKLYEIKDLDQRVDAIVKLMKEHPLFFKESGDGSDAGNLPINMAYVVDDYIEANLDKNDKLRAKLSAIDNAFAPDNSLGKSLYETTVAGIFLKKGVALEYAATLAQSSIDLFHQDEYTAFERANHANREEYESLNDKDYVPEAFNSGDADVHFHQKMSVWSTTLADIEAKLGKNPEALEAYTQAIKFHPNMKAYLGVAKLQEAKGDKSEALESLYGADLSGHLDSKNIVHMQQLYAELNPGSSEQSLESLLDIRYKAAFHNPIAVTPYVASSTRSDRTILVELFTGAACEPCMAPDLAVDASLERYTRGELVLLVHHDNAPLSDPLANDVTEERATYYSTGGSTPHVFLDGKELKLVEGLPLHAQDAFDSTVKSIDQRLDVPAGAHLEIQAERQGSKVRVVVDGAVLAAQPRLFLHIDLVETVLSYSGENGLRLQPMVVRATAKQAESASGLPLAGHHKIEATYTFDLKQIEAANLVYYDRFDAGLKKRTHGMAGASYREKKNIIDPTKLAAVAFVQNDTTKEVLQSAFASVLNDGSPELSKP